jgi:hypothetical protein
MKQIRSFSTSPDDALDIAERWMSKCRCADAWEESGRKWYPRRLLDLTELRGAKHDLRRAKVRLVETDNFFQETGSMGTSHVSTNHEYRYITLSHCWGKPREGYEPLRLTDITMARFMSDGIELDDFPNTYRDALLFACKLNGVRFVWIDSLCIRQALDGEGYVKQEQLRDWFEQSRFMDRVYRKAYLNISATASSDGHGGLFRSRAPGSLQQDTIDVYCPFANEATKSTFVRCTVTLASAWVELVDQAPINKRGWVFQERLLAPRVLHFCHNQVAWE